MSDRPVRLDLRAQADARASAQTSHSQRDGAREQPSQDQLDRFRDALGSKAGGDESDGARQELASPFALFGLARAVSLQLEGAASDGAGRLTVLADEIAERILVAEDGGNDARILIQEDILPGVEVRIRREQGRWIVTFSIADPDSFRLLEASGDQITAELAQRLRSEVEVQLIDVLSDSHAPVRVFIAVATTVGENR
jgi:hypothetical protein